MPLSELDDRELLVAARSDRDAFAELYRRHATGLLAYFGRALGRSDLALDLTAETFASALLALPQYQPSEAPGASWLYAIARSRLVDALRRGAAEARARERLGMRAVVLDDHGEAALNRLIDELDGRAALAVLGELPEEQRQALTARFLDGRDYAEIAAEMRCSEQVVRKRVSRGLRGLR